MANTVNIRSGMVMRWVGLPGQHDNDNLIRIDSTTAEQKVNACILSPGGRPLSLVSIGAADLLAAVDAGWLVPAQPPRPSQGAGDG